MLPLPWRVRRRLRETHDTFTLELSPVPDAPAAAFAPGQFNMLYVHGAGEVPISISGDPASGRGYVHTIRAVGGVTGVMQGLRKGDVLGLRGPFGTPWPLEAAEGGDLVIVAGGIGLAPLRPAVYRAMSHRRRYGRVAVLYGTRTPADLLYARELGHWSARGDIEVRVTVDRGDEGWKGNVGVVTTLVPGAGFDPAKATALVCGPELMMRFAVLSLRGRGVAPDRIYVSMERNMKCAVGFCGHCQYGPAFVCKDGPVFRFDRIERTFGMREL
jgi:NAD(P)H-flavin reductase